MYHALLILETRTAASPLHERVHRANLGVQVIAEFRYTRWGSEAFRDPVRALLNSNRNQGDFLLGLTF